MKVLLLILAINGGYKDTSSIVVQQNTMSISKCEQVREEITKDLKDAGWKITLSKCYD